LFLNEHWTATGKRAPESTIKMLSDQVSYLTGALKQALVPPASPDKLRSVTELHRLAQHVASTLPATPTPATGLVDLAAGSTFVLSSRHNACPKKPFVCEHQPFFFHTGEGRNQFITIDLKTESRLFELRITNRSDTCRERAQCLFYCVHDDPTPNLQRGFPVTLDEAFLSPSNQISVTDLRGCQARYLTIFSSETTHLHFAEVKVLGLPLQAEPMGNQ
jgi:hypothetical protein